MIKLINKIKFPSFDSIALLGLIFTIIGTYYSVFDWLEADIKGDWNSKKAVQVIAKEIKINSNYLKDKGCTDDNCVIENLSFTEFTPDKETVLIAIETKQEDATRHAQAIISLFEFKKNKFGWNLVLKDVESFFASNFGTLDESDIEIKYIGSNIYGIFIREVSPGIGGSNSSVINIYTRLKDSYVKVLSYYEDYTEVRYTYPRVKIETGKEGGREKSVETKFEILKNGLSGFYDLEIDVTESISYFFKEDSPKDIGKHNYIIKLYFNGKKYVSSTNTQIQEEGEDETEVIIQDEELIEENEV